MRSLRTLRTIDEERARDANKMTDKINARAREFEQKKCKEAEAEEEAKRQNPHCTLHTY